MRNDFEFCKTAQKPYDKYVVAMLIAVAQITDSISVSSDGDQEDWLEGLQLYVERCTLNDTLNDYAKELIPDNIMEMYEKKEIQKLVKEITEEASTVFDNTKYNKSKWSPQFDVEGTINSYEFKLNKGTLSIACLDYSIKMENQKNKIDNLRISLMTREYIDFLTYKAYK